MDPSQPINWTLVNELASALTQEQKDEAEWRIANASKVPLEHFKITIACLFALASIVFLGRITIRLASRYRLFLDDGLLGLSFAFLASATAIFYKTSRMTYLLFALMRGDWVATLIATQEIDDVYNHLNYTFPYIFCLWSSIFMVKLCYFAFFHTLLKSMPKGLIRFYWGAITFTTIAWIYLCLQQLISCPYFGKSSAKCFPNLPVSPSVMTFTVWIGPVLDALTDVAIISIPIVVLRKSQMALISKISFGLFLCLSFFMLACSITRAAGTYYADTFDTPWQVFFLHAEACIGVFMASITVYRTLLLRSQTSSSIRKFLERAIHIRTSERLDEVEEPQSSPGRFGQLLLLGIPTATLTGLGTLFGITSHRKSQSGQGVTVDSAFELTETDYHEHIKELHSNDLSNTIPTTFTSTATSRRQDSLMKDVISESHGEKQRFTNRFQAFVFRMLIPRSHRVILQHRAVGSGDANRIESQDGRYN